MAKFNYLLLSLLVFVSQSMYAGKNKRLSLRMMQQQQEREEHLRTLEQKNNFMPRRSNNNVPHHFGSSDTVKATLLTLVLLSAVLPTTLAANCESQQCFDNSNLLQAFATDSIKDKCAKLAAGPDTLETLLNNPEASNVFDGILTNYQFCLAISGASHLDNQHNH